MSQIYPIINLPALNKEGLVPTFVSTTTLEILAGQCRDSTNTIDLLVGSPNIEGQTVAAPLILDFTVKGVNGVDVLPLTNNSMYAIYLIGSSTYRKPTTCIASLANATIGVPPLLPHDYDVYRLIGFWAVDGSGLLINGAYAGLSNDMKFYYDGLFQVLNDGEATTYTNVNLSAFVPVSILSTVTLQALYTPAVDSDSASLKIVSFTNANIIINSPVANVPFYAQVQMPAVFTQGLQQIQYKVTSGSDGLSLYVSAFEVTL
jgi:hypothetical protein